MIQLDFSKTLSNPRAVKTSNYHCNRDPDSHYLYNVRASFKGYTK